MFKGFISKDPLKIIKVRKHSLIIVKHCQTWSSSITCLHSPLSPAGVGTICHKHESFVISAEISSHKSSLIFAEQPLASSASKRSIQRFVITEKAPTRAFSWLKAATTDAFTFKTLFRHYAKRALTRRRDIGSATQLS